MDRLDTVYEGLLIDQVRPASVRAGAEWLLDEEEVIETLVDTEGDPEWLAWDLKALADVWSCCGCRRTVA